MAKYMVYGYAIALPTLIDWSDLIAVLALLMFTLCFASSSLLFVSGGSSKKEEKRKAKEAEKKARTNLMSHEGATLW